MKKAISIILTVALCLSMFTVVFAENDEILINSAADLKAVASTVASDGGNGKTFKLTADINLEGIDWNDYIIGSASSAFKGTFDGNGHTIINFKISVPSGDYNVSAGNELCLGLFGAIGGSAVIKNLGVSDVTFYSSASWGYNSRGGAITAKAVDNAKIDKCFVRNVTFDTKSDAGKAQLGEAGGLVGYVDGAVEITNCYSVNFVEENDCIAHEAGLAGLLNNFAKFENCYSDKTLCTVVSSKASSISNSYCTNTTDWCANVRGGTRVSADQLKEKYTNLGEAFKAGTNYNNGFPVLSWEADAESLSGTGSEEDPYIINNKADLIEVSINASIEGAHYKLNADIDLYDALWTTYIGTAENQFKGVFDGNGHTIKNFKLEVPQGDSKDGRVGLFAVVGGSGIIKNLAVENVSVYSKGSWGYNCVVGPIVAELAGSAVVTSCYARNVVVDTKDVNIGSCGGMIGMISSENASVSNCYTLEFAEVGDCISTEDGFIGRIDAVKSVENCYAATTLAAVKSEYADRITNCYAVSMTGWAPSGYTRAGETITVSALKQAAATLGSAFKEGGVETLGFPALAWQEITPIVYISRDTYVDGGKINFVYECEFDYTSDDKISIYFENSSGSTANELVTLEEGKIYVASNLIDDVTAPDGKYKFNILRDGAHSNTLVTITSPDGSIIRRGDSLFTDGLNDINRIVARVYGEDIITRAEIVAYPEYVAKEFTLLPEPQLTGFEAKAYNLVSSYDSDGKTTRAFAWTAVEEFDQMEVKYKVKGTDEWQSVPAIAEEVVDDYYMGVNYFKADITGLTPGTEYVYKIGKTGSDNADDWGKEYTFKTEAENVNAFKFITISDTQGTAWEGDVKYSQATLQAAINDVPDTAFVFNAGDLIQDATNDTGSWDLYFKALKGVCETVPHFAAIGNHDIWKHIEGNTHLGMGENMLFDLHLNHPNNGGTAAVDMTAADLSPSNIGIPILFQRQNFDETIYSFDYGNAHFVVLNSGGSWGADTDDVVLLNAQKEWLKADLEANQDARWKIFIMHRPAYASSKPVYDNLVFGDVFKEYGVDLVIHGDEHWTARSYQLDGYDIVEPSKSNVDLLTKGNGTVYTLVGSIKTFGNSHVTYNGTFHEEMFMGNGTDDKLPVYATFDITDEKIEVTHKQIDGMIVDNFTIIADDAATQVVRVSQFDVAVKELLQLTSGYKAKAETNGDAKVMVAYYDADDKLLNTQLADENNEFVVCDKTNVAEIKLFALESTDNIKPLSAAYSIR